MSLEVTSLGPKFDASIDYISNNCFKWLDEIQSKDKEEKVRKVICDALKRLTESMAFLSLAQYETIYIHVIKLSYDLTKATGPIDRDLLNDDIQAISFNTLRKDVPIKDQIKSKMADAAPAPVKPAAITQESIEPLTKAAFELEQEEKEYMRLKSWAQHAVDAATKGVYGDDTRDDFFKFAKEPIDFSYIFRVTFAEWLRQSCRIVEMPEIFNVAECKRLIKDFETILPTVAVKLFSYHEVSPKEEECIERIRLIWNTATTYVVEKILQRTLKFPKNQARLDSKDWEKYLFEDNAGLKAFAAASEIPFPQFKDNAMETISSTCISSGQLAVAEMAARAITLIESRERFLDQIKAEKAKSNLDRLFNEGAIAEIAKVYQGLKLDYPYDGRLEQILEKGIKEKDYESVLRLMPFVIDKKPQFSKLIDSIPEQFQRSALKNVFANNQCDKAFIICRGMKQELLDDILSEFVTQRVDSGDFTHVKAALELIKNNYAELIVQIAGELPLQKLQNLTDKILWDLVDDGRFQEARELVPFLLSAGVDILNNPKIEALGSEGIVAYIESLVKNEDFAKAFELTKVLRKDSDLHEQKLIMIAQKCGDSDMAKKCHEEATSTEGKRITGLFFDSSKKLKEALPGAIRA